MKMMRRIITTVKGLVEIGLWAIFTLMCLQIALRGMVTTQQGISLLVLAGSLLFFELDRLGEQLIKAIANSGVVINNISTINKGERNADDME